MGHVRNYTTTDVIARYKTQCGYEVIQPMGWDAFGLPAENAAIANNAQPAEWTQQNIDQMRSQMKQMGIDIDWDREIATNDPNFYRWTQWIFIQMMKEGIAYQKEGEVNFDPMDNTVLANEQIDKEGRSWRSGAIAEKRMMTQWYFRITQYADEMKSDIDNMSGFPGSVRAMQRHWIENMHDWCISRQRFWGTPIPVIHCPHCGAIPEKEENLPISFPTPNRKWENYREQIDEWKHTTCPICGEAAIRETDTMDTFVDSSWYFFRYIDPTNTTAPFDSATINHWAPMDVYVGGIEHATAHLIYARFVTKFLRDIGMINFDEPIEKLITQGMVRGITYKNPKTGQYFSPQLIDATNPIDPTTGDIISVSWEKMSKSKFNGIDTQAMFERYGSDTVRTYMMFKAPIDRDIDWNERDIMGVHRFIGRIKHMADTFNDDGSFDPKITEITSKAMTAYHDDMKRHQFHTAIAKIMAFYNSIKAMPNSSSKRQVIEAMAEMIYPFAPETAQYMMSMS